MRDQGLQPYNTTGNIIALYLLNFFDHSHFYIGHSHNILVDKHSGQQVTITPEVPGSISGNALEIFLGMGPPSLVRTIG